MIERTPDTPPPAREADSGQRTAPAGAPVSSLSAVSAPPLTARDAAEVASVVSGQCCFTPASADRLHQLWRG